MNDSTYSLIDFGDGRRLEQWGRYRLIRPDPTARGTPGDRKAWGAADAEYVGEKGKGEWRARAPLPDHWPVMFDDLCLAARLAPYKHTGVFPEQLENWRWARARGKVACRPLAVLNLFAYTGGATAALAADGHHVTHVDAAKPSISWAKENAALNNVAADRTRWILDDAPAFVARERRRGKTYDAIILDPPAFGHSPTGKAWRVERDLTPLLADCCAILTDTPAFVVLNGYAREESPESLREILTAALRSAGRGKGLRVDARDLTLESASGRGLSTGVVARASVG